MADEREPMSLPEARKLHAPLTAVFVGCALGIYFLAAAIAAILRGRWPSSFVTTSFDVIFSPITLIPEPFAGYVSAALLGALSAVCFLFVYAILRNRA
jgi:hypothetical protein